MTEVDEIVERHRGEEGAVLNVLLDVQDELRYLPRDALERVSERMDVPLARLFGVATFYTAFSFVPRGRHTVQVCMGTTCYVRGSQHILDKIRKDLSIEPGGTTEDLRYSLESVRCVGCCAIAPVVMIDKRAHGKIELDKVDEILAKYE